MIKRSVPDGRFIFTANTGFLGKTARRWMQSVSTCVFAIFEDGSPIQESSDRRGKSTVKSSHVSMTTSVAVYLGDW